MATRHIHVPIRIVVDGDPDEATLAVLQRAVDAALARVSRRMTDEVGPVRPTSDAHVHVPPLTYAPGSRALAPATAARIHGMAIDRARNTFCKGNTSLAPQPLLRRSPNAERKPPGHLLAAAIPTETVVDTFRTRIEVLLWGERIVIPLAFVRERQVYKTRREGTPPPAGRTIQLKPWMLTDRSTPTRITTLPLHAYPVGTQILMSELPEWPIPFGEEGTVTIAPKQRFTVYAVTPVKGATSTHVIVERSKPNAKKPRARKQRPPSKDRPPSRPTGLLLSAVSWLSNQLIALDDMHLVNVRRTRDAIVGTGMLYDAWQKWKALSSRDAQLSHATFGLSKLTPPELNPWQGELDAQAATLQLLLQKHGFPTILHYELAVQEFLRTFTLEAVQTALRRLASLARILKAQRERYRDAYYGRQLFDALHSYRDELEKLNLSRYLNRGGGAKLVHDGPSVQKALTGLKATTVAKVRKQHPLLGLRGFPFSDLVSTDRHEVAAYMRDYVDGLLEKVEEVRTEVLEDEDRLWELDVVVDEALAAQRIPRGSVFEKIVRKKQADVNKPTVWDALLIAFDLLTLFSALGWLGRGLRGVGLVASAGVSSASLVQAYSDYSFRNAAYEAQVRLDDASMGWLIAGALGAGVDLATFARLARSTDLLVQARRFMASNDLDIFRRAVMSLPGGRGGLRAADLGRLKRSMLEAAAKQHAAQERRGDLLQTLMAGGEAALLSKLFRHLQGKRRDLVFEFDDWLDAAKKTGVVGKELSTLDVRKARWLFSATLKKLNHLVRRLRSLGLPDKEIQKLLDDYAASAAGTVDDIVRQARAKRAFDQADDALSQAEKAADVSKARLTELRKARRSRLGELEEVTLKRLEKRRVTLQAELDRLEAAKKAELTKAERRLANAKKKHDEAVAASHRGPGPLVEDSAAAKKSLDDARDKASDRWDEAWEFKNRRIAEHDEKLNPVRTNLLEVLSQLKKARGKYKASSKTSREIFKAQARAKARQLRPTLSDPDHDAIFGTPVGAHGEVDHVVSLDTVMGMPRFGDLNHDAQLAVANLTKNLRVLDSGLNASLQNVGSAGRSNFEWLAYIAKNPGLVRTRRSRDSLKKLVDEAGGFDALLKKNPWFAGTAGPTRMKVAHENAKSLDDFLDRHPRFGQYLTRREVLDRIRDAKKAESVAKDAVLAKIEELVKAGQTRPKRR